MSQPAHPYEQEPTPLSDEEVGVAQLEQTVIAVGATAIVDGAESDSPKADQPEAGTNHYEDLTFYIDSTPFKSQGVTSTSIERCYRASMKALAQVDETYESFAERPYAEKQARAVNNFLGRSKKIAGRYIQPKQYISAADISGAVASELDKLAEANHPVAQLVGHIHDRYGESLSPAEYRALCDRIVLATRSKSIIDSLRKLLPNS
jgi:hypothetical protein